MVLLTFRYFMRSAMANFSTRSVMAVCQLTSSHNLEENFLIASNMMKRAKEHNAKMIFFPECFDFVGRNKKESMDLAMDAEGEYINRYRDLARISGLWVSLGGFHEKDPENLKKPFNTHLIIDDKGETRGKYRKLHIFDLNIPGKVRLMESEFSSAGDEITKPVQTPIGNVAMSICYDLRFAELALIHRRNGAHILSYPSAFTLNTGLAHWEALLRARAIETQCYVVASAQTGKHNEKRISFGHSMVVDPWGAIIAQCSETVDMCFCEVKLDYLDEVRTTQPVFSHRRYDLYSVITTGKQMLGGDSFTFGGSIISPDVVFYESVYSFAFVNRSPVVPGHVLVCPKRCVNHLLELEDHETADLFIASKRIQSMLESHYSTASSNVSVQDGPFSGQTVEHVHVHILPRREGDFEGDPDKVYVELAKHDKPGQDRQHRALNSMKDEAALYRCLIYF